MQLDLILPDTGNIHGMANRYVFYQDVLFNRPVSTLTLVENLTQAAEYLRNVKAGAYSYLWPQLVYASS